MDTHHFLKTIYSKLNKLNVRLALVSLALMIPTLMLITWITLRNTENVRIDRLNEKQNELDIAVSQMDLTLDILDASIVNFVAGNPDFRLIASAQEQDTEFWLMNERLYQQISRLGDFASLDLHMSVCFPSQDLFYNREADPGLTRKISAVITGREPDHEFDRWLVFWSGGTPYLGRIYDFTDYYVTCCISLGSLLDNIGLTGDQDEKYWLTDPQMHILNISDSSDITVSGLLAHHGEDNWKTLSSLSAQTGYRICSFLKTDSLEQPHFILNSLNTLYNYSEKDVATTRSIIRLLSRYYRHVINVNSSYISLREEFSHIDDYLKLQQIRYPGRFDYEIDCPDSTGNLPVPPFLIESFVGNSIKYALGGKAKVMLLIQSAETASESTRITVSDTGPGFTDDVLDAISEYQQSGIVSEELGVGIRNAIDRLHLIYQGQAQIIFSNVSPHGARVDILITSSGDLKELTKEQTNGDHF